MVGLKQKENRETKRDKRPPSYIGGAKMAKIFATKALSMVLCFVMLFMGAPVTTWAEVTQAITVQKNGETVTGDDIMLDTASGTLTLTAQGFTGDDVTWELSNNAETWVSLSSQTGEETTLTLNTLPAFDTTVQVTAIGIAEASQSATVMVNLKKPAALTVDLPDDAAARGISENNGVVTVSRGAACGDFSFRLFIGDDLDTDVAQTSYFSSNQPAVLAQPSGDAGDLSIFHPVSVGVAVVTAQESFCTVAFPVIVNSGIDHVSIVRPDSATARPGGSISLSAKAFADADEQNEITELGDAPFAWSITEGDSYADVDATGTVTFSGGSAGQTVTVTVASTFGPSESAAVTFAVLNGQVSATISAGDGTSVDGWVVTLNADGDGSLLVSGFSPAGPYVSVEVQRNGAVVPNVAAYSETDGQITITGAADGDQLTITAGVTGYDDFSATYTLMRASMDADFTVTDADGTVILDQGVFEGELKIPYAEEGTYTLTHQAFDAEDNEMDADFTWESDDEAVFTVADGVITLVAAGEAKLTVSVLDGEGNAIVEKTIAVTVEKAAAEVKVYSDVAMETEVTDSVTFSDSEEKALYVNPVLSGSTTGVADVSWTVTLGETTLGVGTGNKIDLSDATDRQTLTIKATHDNYDFGDDVVLTINVEAAAKKDAELQACVDAGFTAALTGSVMLDSSGNGALCVRAVDKGTNTKVPDATLTASITSGTGTAVLDQATGCVTISGASDGAVLTISSTTPSGYNDIQPLTIMLHRSAAPPVQVYGVDVWRTDDMNMESVSSLRLGVGDTVDLTASVSSSASDNGVEWLSDKPSVVSVSGNAYAATLTAKAVGTATITVASVDDKNVTHALAVTVEGAVDLSFTPHAGVYNKDLWGGDFAGEARARYARMIGTVPTGTDLTQFTTISIKNSSGEFVVEEKPSTNYLTDIPYYVEDWAASIRGEGLLAVDALPVCFVHSSMSIFELGEYDITLRTLSGQEFTTSINIVDNDFYEDASWTTGSSEDLLIAKMPGITNDLLVEFVSGLKILKDGTHLLKDKGITDILVVDAETGNVYIKKEILDTLEAGTYSIGFTVVGNEELLNFTVVDHRDIWGTPSTRLVDHKVQYIDSAGKTSIELTSENLANGILWLLEDSGGASAWYGIDLSTGAFELDKGSRFYVQWLHQDDAEYDTYYAQLDDEQKSQIENGWIFLIGVEDASGNKVQPESPVKTYVQIGDDWDLDELKAYYIAAGEDQSIDVEDILGFAYPEGEDEFGMMMLSHFSPYLIMDELSDAERGVVVQGSGSGSGYNNKTGDQAVQVAVAGFGSILVLALGIMLRLITRKKKFEE